LEVVDLVTSSSEFDYENDLKALVLASESWYEGTSPFYQESCGGWKQVMPGHWLRLVLCVTFSTLTLLA